MEKQQTNPMDVIKRYQRARELCKECLFQCVTAETNGERRIRGREFRYRYKHLKTIKTELNTVAVEFLEKLEEVTK